MSNDALEEVGLPTPAESEAVNPAEPNTPLETAADGVVEEKQEEPAKTFTQAEVDAMVQKRLLKEQRRLSRDLERKLTEQQQAKALVPPERNAFRDDDEFLQAQIDHLAEKKAAEKIAERERAKEAEQRSESFMEKAEKASERYVDFQAVVGNPTLAINESMAEFIADSDLGPDVAYHLGKNPAKAAQIAQMSPVKAARELARIEAEIASKPKAKPSNAPEPINPVGSRGKSTTSSLPSDDDDIETWMRKERDRQRKR
jgi:hypothetical protein